jgi:hypothetical protein
VLSEPGVTTPVASSCSLKAGPDSVQRRFCLGSSYDHVTSRGTASNLTFALKDIIQNYRDTMTVVTLYESQDNADFYPPQRCALTFPLRQYVRLNIKLIPGRPPLPLRKYSLYSFLLETESMKNSSDTTGNRTRNLSTCNAVP